jgi:ATP-dependent Clp protease adaptor protein ClpS
LKEAAPGNRGGLFSVHHILPAAPSLPYYAAMQILGANERKDDEGSGTGVGIATRTRTRTKQPAPYKVLMLNDDYTPMEFVVLCLQRFFRMSMEDATRVMLHVHQKGVGVCGIFSYEVAETKVTQVMDFAKTNQHPLQCTLEKA